MSLGMNHLFAQANPTLRLGKLNETSQSAYFDARLQSRNVAPDAEYYLYFRPQARWVGYNATLQGGMYLKDRGAVTVKPEPWLLSSQFGAMYANEIVTLKMEYVMQTKESENSLFRHQYGSISLGIRF